MATNKFGQAREYRLSMAERDSTTPLMPQPYPQAPVGLTPQGQGGFVPQGQPGAYQHGFHNNLPSGQHPASVTHLMLSTDPPKGLGKEWSSVQISRKLNPLI